MPSYVFAQTFERDEVLSKTFCSLDLRDHPGGLAPDVKAVGFRRAQAACLSPVPGPLSAEESASPFPRAGPWGKIPEGPPSAGWGHASFWGDRADGGGLGWPCPDAAPAKRPPAAPGCLLSSRYKTELCRTFEESGGVCKYGAKCQFAHGAEELRDLSRHPKYKTERCRTFHTVGICPYGTRCHFVHNAEEEQQQQRQARDQAASRRRPPPLTQSVSFAGFPSAFQPHETPALLPRGGSASPPGSCGVPELLSPTFPEHEAFPVFSDLGLHFLPSADGAFRGAGRGGSAASDDGFPRQPPFAGLAPGSRSMSATSLSDHEGGSGSSASSLSGSDTSVFECFGRRLPIFSQLSVPDERLSSPGFVI
ncbi:mRNA decay activator protein ZFP36L1 [Lepisosteus oculatus]|uniref:mRNA decay activator protein ZFP36L1 n=1 Tax=Lepisosteus oculatus TaxID=7918 RepID=UPI0037150E04